MWDYLMCLKLGIYIIWTLISCNILTRPMHRRTDANLYPPERQPTKAIDLP